MARIFKRGENRVTFCTVKCFSTGEGFDTKKSAILVENSNHITKRMQYDLSYNSKEC